MTDATTGNGNEDSHPQARRRIRRLDLATGNAPRPEAASGDQLQIIETDDGVILRPVESNDVGRQMRTARDVMDKYEVALQGLAK